MSNKKKDLAQELVDFLMKEDDIVKAKGPKLVTPQTSTPKNPVEEQKTAPLKDEKTIIPEAEPLQNNNEAVFEFSVHAAQLPMEDPKEKGFSIESEDPNKNTIKLIDHADLEFKTEAKPKTEGASEIKTARTVHQSTVETVSLQEPVKSTSVPDFKTTPSGMATNLSSQRSNIIFNDVSNLLAGTEAVKVAQARIKALEKEKEQVRAEMEQLLTGSESLQRRLNELRAQHESLERKHKEKIEILEDEKSVFKTRLNAKEEELSRIKKENEDLHARFQNDIRKIRVRERELESRQEIMRAEMTTVVTGKDEVIMELRRQLEKLSFEIDTFRTKSADTNKKLTEFYDRNHRTVKALRLALSILEVGDADDKSKKVG